MGIKILLHHDLAYLAGQNDVVETTGSTVGECIGQLVAKHPVLKDLIFYRDGQLQTFVEIYVNRKSTHANELSYKVVDGDEINLTLTIAGG